MSQVRTPRAPRGFRFDRTESALLATVGLLFVYIAVVRVDAALPVRYFVLSALGRVDSRCTLALARLSLARDRELTAGLDRVALDPARSRPDQGLRRWDGPKEPVWTPVDASPMYAGRVRAADVRNSRWELIDEGGIVPVQSGDIVIDGGGHLGSSTFKALQLGAARVITVEPDPNNVRSIRLNFAKAIADGRVIVVDKGIYDRVGFLSFVRRSHSADGEFHEGEAHGESLPVTTIDRIVADLNLPRVDFIKLDIEGSEVPALRGAVETLRRFKPRIAVGTYHRPGDLASVEQAILSARADYRSACSRCLEDRGRLFPLLLYFH